MTRITKVNRLVVWAAAIFLFLAAICVFIKARSTSAVPICINNLRHISAAKEQWVEDHHKTENDIPTWSDLRPYLLIGTDKVPVCPSGGTYTIGRVGEEPKCSLGDHDSLHQLD
jgi:hypothetical protein